MKKIIALFLLITIYFLMFGQIKPKKFIHWKIQHVIVNSQDTSYKYTKIINNHGEVEFYNRYVKNDTLYIDTIYISYKLRPRSKFQNMRQIKKNEYNSDISDTINNYFSFSEITDTLMKPKKEVKYSYILQQLDEPILKHNNHNGIRIIEPLEDLNICTEYMILETRFFADSAKIYKTNCKIKGFEGIQVTEKDSFLLKKRHVKNLLKDLKKVRTANIKNKECRNIGNPSILEYNFENEYDNFIFSYYCKRENKKAIADEVWDLHSYLGTLRIKYFRRMGSK